MNRADSASISMSDNLNLVSGLKISKQEEIVQFLNRFRYKNHNIISKLMDYIHES